MAKIAIFAGLLATVTALAACSSSGTSTRSSVTASGVNASGSSASGGRVTFTSMIYRYTVTVPASWATVQASSRWDGASKLSIESPEVDQFYPTVSGKGYWAVAAPWKRDLAAYTTFLINWNYRFHGDFCPPQPTARTAVSIGGQPGVLLAYNCGIVINIAATVHNGVAYEFALRDSNVPAASTPADHAEFVALLRTVSFPA